MRPRSADRGRKKERRRGSDQRGITDRPKVEDRRSGQDRRKFHGSHHRIVERLASEEIDQDPKCQRCIAILGEFRVLILECPFPEKACVYKQHYEIIHYVTYPSARVENGSAVVASSPEDLMSPSIILMRPDPILKEHQIYLIDVTDSRTV